MEGASWRHSLVSAAAGAAVGAASVAVCLWLVADRGTGSPSSSDRADSTTATGNGGSTTTPARSFVPRPVAPMAAILEDDILKEHFQRNIQFFGPEAQRKIAGSFVVVVGLGGVGSHAAHMLLRSGVGKLRLIDFDQVTLSTLNRHCVATRADVGLPKATCLARHFAEIVPECEIDARVQMFEAASQEELLSGSPDYVIDAIDNINTKVDLLAACVRRGIRVLCSGGAGARVDPTRLHFSDISESVMDNLGRAVRARLKKAGIESGVEILFSSEKPTAGLVSLEAMQSGNPSDYQVIPNFRVRTIPVLGTSPTLFGVAAAARVLTELAGQPFAGREAKYVDEEEMRMMLVRLEGREEQRFGEGAVPGVTWADLHFLIVEVFRCRSAVSGGGFRDMNLCRSISRLHLTRWDRTKPCVVDNLVLLEKGEADEHDELPDMASVAARWGADAVQRIEKLLEGVRRAYTFPATW